MEEKLVSFIQPQFHAGDAPEYFNYYSPTTLTFLAMRNGELPWQQVTLHQD
jgi:hypothetical protein